MTASPFVFDLRSRRGIVRLDSANDRAIVSGDERAALNLRVEVPEIWDVVRVVAPPIARVLDVKIAALDALLPGAAELGYVMKLRGIEILDEELSVEKAGAIDGSIFLLTNRRRRPVR